MAFRIVAWRSFATWASRPWVTVLRDIRSVLGSKPVGSAVPRIPGSGLVLDVLCCIPALLVLGRRALDGSYSLLSSWTYVPMGLLAVWVGLSPLWAADRFSATVSAAHVVASFAFLWSASQLV